MPRPPKKISEFDRKLGAAIRHRRLDPDFGMSQADLARATGIPLSNLQRREDGTNEVTVSEIQRIAHALDTTPVQIVNDALKRYGGMEKLLAEYGAIANRAAEGKGVGGESTMSEPDRNVAGAVDDSNVREDPEANISYIGRKQSVPERAAAKKRKQQERVDD